LLRGHFHKIDGGCCIPWTPITNDNLTTKPHFARASWSQKTHVMPNCIEPTSGVVW